MISDAVVVAGLPHSTAARLAFGRLCVMGFLAYCSYAMCRTPLLPLLARELGATPPMVGFVVGASTLTGIVVKLPAGAWSDVIGRRPLLLLGTIMFAVMPFTYLGIASLGVLVALRFVHGSATAIFGPVASASLSDLAPPGRRATWLSSYSTLQGVGQALGPVIAGYLIARGRYDVAFITAGLFAATTPLLAAGWPAAPRSAAAPRRMSEFAKGILEVCRQPLILITSLAQAAQFVLNGTLNAFLPLYGREVLGLTVTQLGWLFGAQTLTTLAVRPAIGWVSDRAGRRWIIVTGLTVCSAMVLLVSFATSTAEIFTVTIAYAAGVAITTAATSAYITDVTHRARYGAAHGVFGTIYDVGDALGPIAAGILVASTGYTRMFQVMAAVAFTMAVAFALTSRINTRSRKE
jgi:DHA1 family multidrug resistance protein-like MFS transporter